MGFRDGFVGSVEEELSVGQKVNVRVVSIDRENGKMGLSMKAESAEKVSFPDLSAFQGLPSDQWFSGRVVNIAPFGAFVEVTAPEGGGVAIGLVHISEVKDGLVESVEDEFH